MSRNEEDLFVAYLGKSTFWKRGRFMIFHQKIHFMITAPGWQFACRLAHLAAL